MSTSKAWRLCGALLVATLAVPGCKSQGGEGAKPKEEAKKAEAPKPAAVKPADKPAEAAKAPVAKAEAPKTEAPKTEAPKTEAPKAEAPKTAPAKPAEAKAAPGTLSTADEAQLKELAADAKRREEMRSFLVLKYTEMGDELYSVGEWEKAREKYSDILDLDPGNAHASRRIEEIGAHLNDRGASAASAFESMKAEAAVRREKARMEVAALVSTGKAAEGRGEWDAAVAAYEKALIIAELQAYSVDVQPNADALRGMISDAKQRRTKAELSRRQEEFRAAQEVKKAEEAREREQRRVTIQTLFRDANAAMEQERYQTAQSLAEEILRIDPTNGDAQTLRGIAVRSNNAQYESTIRADLREQWKKAFEELQKKVIPQTDLVQFPDSWSFDEGLSRAPNFSTQAAFQADPQAAAVRAKLDSVRTPLTIANEETPITDLLQWLSDMTGVNIVLDGKAREGKSDQDLMLQQYNLASPLSVSEILDLVTLGKNLGWTVKNGVVLITTQEAVRGAPVLDLYDVKDITAGIVDFPAEDINLQPSGGGGFALPADEDSEPKKAFEGDAIKDLITNNVDKEVWGQDGANVEYREPGTLVVKAPIGTHQKIRKLLGDLRNTGGMQIAIETRFITVTDNFLQDVGVDLRGLGDDSLGTGVPGKGTNAAFDDVLGGSNAAPAGIGTGLDSGVFYNFGGGEQDLRARVENLYDQALGKAGILTPTGGTTVTAVWLDDTQVEAILRAVQKSERSTQVIAPRITAYNSQRANVQVLNQVSYISDYDVEIAQLSQIGDPIIQQLRDGIILDIRPVISADRRFITMELRPTVALLQRPIQTFSTTLGNGPPVSIQLPEIRIQRVRTTVTVPDGGTLLLGGLNFYEEQKYDSSVPFLAEIPILNFFWSRRGTFIERRNLFILLKATIIRLEEHEPNMGKRG
ncbi:MAG: hypothetical protein L6R43_06525 [Planctomycetes bacterium]|nr:hypothetical protein [Planctomycetota bacterium]